MLKNMLLNQMNNKIIVNFPLVVIAVSSFGYFLTSTYVIFLTFLNKIFSIVLFKLNMKMISFCDDPKSDFHFNNELNNNHHISNIAPASNNNINSELFEYLEKLELSSKLYDVNQQIESISSNVESNYSIPYFRIGVFLCWALSTFLWWYFQKDDYQPNDVDDNNVNFSAQTEQLNQQLNNLEYSLLPNSEIISDIIDVSTQSLLGVPSSIDCDLNMHHFIIVIKTFYMNNQYISQILNHPLFYQYLLHLSNNNLLLSQRFDLLSLESVNNFEFFKLRVDCFQLIIDLLLSEYNHARSIGDPKGILNPNNLLEIKLFIDCFFSDQSEFLEFSQEFVRNYKHSPYRQP